MRSFKAILIILGVLFYNNSFSQRWKLTRYEVFSSLGIGLSQNDIVGVSEYTIDNFFGLEEAFALRNMGYTGFVGMRYRVTERISARLSIDGGLMKGADPKSRNSIRKYKTLFIEPSVHFEYSILKESVVASRYSIMDYRGGVRSNAKKNAIMVYFFGGIGTTLFKPSVNEAIRSGSNYEFIESFSKVLIIPAGIGVKQPLTSRSSMGVEVGGRYTLFAAADFIDGFKPSASKSNDLYGFVNVFWSFKLKTARNGLPILFNKSGF